MLWNIYSLQSGSICKCTYFNALHTVWDNYLSSSGFSLSKETTSELIKNYKKVHLLENELYFEPSEQDVAILKKEYKKIQFELIKIDVTDVNEFSSIIFVLKR